MHALCNTGENPDGGNGGRLEPFDFDFSDPRVFFTLFPIVPDSEMYKFWSRVTSAWSFSLLIHLVGGRTS